MKRPFLTLRNTTLLVTALLFAPALSEAQDSLTRKIEEITFSITGDVGVALRLLETGETINYHGDHPFPMQSVYKFPLAMAVLKQVDMGKLSLDQNVHVTKADYFETHSPLMEKYPKADVDVTVSELINYTITQSDNVTCDLLFRLLGGPKKVDLFIQSLGVKNISILNTEREMHAAWKTQYQNWSTPTAMAELFQVFIQKDVLTKTSKEILLKHLTNTQLGANRLRSGLPKETLLAHRTGTGGKNEQGVTSAINDAGIVTLPDGRLLVIVVYVMDTKSDIKSVEEAIANIAKVAYEHFAKKR